MMVLCQCQCTNRGGGHTASVRKSSLQPHCGVYEALHAKVSKHRPEMLAHLRERLEFGIKFQSLGVLHVTERITLIYKVRATYRKHKAVPSFSCDRPCWSSPVGRSVCVPPSVGQPGTLQQAQSQNTTPKHHCAGKTAPPAPNKRHTILRIQLNIPNQTGNQSIHKWFSIQNMYFSVDFTHVLKAQRTLCTLQRRMLSFLLRVSALRCRSVEHI